jgi:hypothetical protein
VRDAALVLRARPLSASEHAGKSYNHWGAGTSCDGAERTFTGSLYTTHVEKDFLLARQAITRGHDDPDLELARAGKREARDQRGAQAMMRLARRASLLVASICSRRPRRSMRSARGCCGWNRRYTQSNGV